MHFKIVFASVGTGAYRTLEVVLIMIVFDLRAFICIVFFIGIMIVLFSRSPYILFNIKRLTRPKINHFGTSLY
jgi:hypothetical protein